MKLRRDFRIMIDGVTENGVRVAERARDVLLGLTEKGSSLEHCISLSKRLTPLRQLSARPPAASGSD
jgi:hypothetical protein